MGTVTTHTEGRVVVETFDDSVEVAQLPARDAAVQAATRPVVSPKLAAGEVVDDGTPAVAKAKAARKRTAKAKKRR